ncbi:inorganic pyrophosphatase [Natranaerovirga pectinivora]|uniref:inorganic diphosphatase n=1 Tax=Natranaerovirga pectinivora TaxID=682400 RepID=A0A4R3MM49_9FIRM|nr:inorganic diphosphatase [Natranaerovirga pectinivora]TCT16009.1 inorganic pyrophosphatase [Natranaerovirga pectinivora]
MLNQFDKDFWSMLDELFSEYKLEIDRPKGSTHPKYNSYVYPLDYGFLQGTVSSDGSGIDVWVGTSEINKPVAIISSVDVIKGDSEIKILYGCTESEIDLIYKEHNRSDGMKGLLSRRY